MTRAKYIPETVSQVVKETGAHYMCIIRKAIERGVKADDVAALRALAEECVREGKMMPGLKFKKTNN